MEKKDIFSNSSVCELLRNIATAYILTGENRFRIIAYEKAADAVEHLSREIYDIWSEGKMYDVPGIGKGIGQGLEEYFTKGESTHFQSILAGIPPSVFALMKVPGIGPKKAFKLVMHFGFTDEKTILENIKRVAKEDKISGIEGFGAKSQSDILASLEVFERHDRREERMPISYAFDVAQEIENHLRKLPEIKRIDFLGSLRRRVSTIGDIDVAVMADITDAKKIIEHFVGYPGTRSVEASGDRKASILAAGNIRVDLRVQEEDTYGSMLQYFTGSKAHNIVLREFALKQKRSLSEYGIKEYSPDTKDIKPLEDPTLKRFAKEEDFYAHLGLSYIPPEIREGTQEIELAQKGQIPELVDLPAIKGDLHIHTSYDIHTSHDLGQNSVQEIVEKAVSLGYGYVGFSDHNPKISGQSANDIINIMKARKTHIDQILDATPIPYVIGLEVDIQPSGEIALPVEAIEYVDYLIVSLHSSFRMEKRVMTERVLKALSYPKVKIFGHPTGRLIGQRDGVELDWSQIFCYVKEKDIALEINSAPSRLDLPDILVHEAKNTGCRFMVDTDAHSVAGMDQMRYGVYVARRGWLTKNDVVNALPYANFEKWIQM